MEKIGTFGVIYSVFVKDMVNTHNIKQNVKQLQEERNTPGKIKGEGLPYKGRKINGCSRIGHGESSLTNERIFKKDWRQARTGRLANRRPTGLRQGGASYSCTCKDHMHHLYTCLSLRHTPRLRPVCT
jgi:hypothetical protein